MDDDGRIIGFVEKPKTGAKTMPGDPTRCLASMGNYLFTTDVLVQEIVRDAARPEQRARLRQVDRRRRCSSASASSSTTSRRTWCRARAERERGYWRDVGTIDAYWQANMDLVDVHPIFNLYNDRWPIRTIQYNYPPAKFVFANEQEARVGIATDSLV